MKKLNPLHLYFLIVGIIKELLNFRFYWKKMSALEKSGALKEKGLRLDKIKRLYFVENIKPEALMYGEVEEGGVEKFEQQFLADALRKHTGLFLSDGSIELVKVNTKRIKTADYYAYLIWVGFKFDKIKFWNFCYITAYTLGVIYLVKLAIKMWPVLQNWIAA